MSYLFRVPFEFPLWFFFRLDKRPPRRLQLKGECFVWCIKYNNWLFIESSTYYQWPISRRNVRWNTFHYLENKKIFSKNNWKEQGKYRILTREMSLLHSLTDKAGLLRLNTLTIFPINIVKLPSLALSSHCILPNLFSTLLKDSFYIPVLMKTWLNHILA